MGRGRKPIPIKEKLAQNIRLDKAASNIVLHQGSKSVPTPPNHFTKRAEVIYWRLANYLHTKGLLFDTDIDVLFTYAFNVDLNIKAQEYLSGDLSGAEVSKYMKIYNDTTSHMLRISTMFGFNPADKNKITVPIPDKGESGIESSIDKFFEK